MTCLKQGMLRHSFEWDIVEHNGMSPQRLMVCEGWSSDCVHSYFYVLFYTLKNRHHAKKSVVFPYFWLSPDPDSHGRQRCVDPAVGGGTGHVCTSPCLPPNLLI